MLALAETLGQVFLQLAYLIFVRGMLILLNALYQVFNFFTGGNFIGHIMGVGSDGTFMIDWNSPLAIMFITAICAGLIILLFMIGLTMTQNLMATKEEKNKTYIVTKVKYIFYFLGAIIGIPFIFLFLNMITMVLGSVLGVGTSLRVDDSLIISTKNNLYPLVQQLINMNTLQINGADLKNFLATFNTELQSNYQQAIAAGNQALADQLQNAMTMINTINPQLDNLSSLQQGIIDSLGTMKPNEINVVLSDQLLNYINQLEGLNNNLHLLFESSTTLKNQFSTLLSSNLNQCIEGYLASFNDLTPTGLGYFTADNQGIIDIIINGNNDNITGLFTLRTYISGMKDFDLVLEIYRLTTNNPKATNWLANPRFVKVDTLLIGIIASLISVIIIALYTIYVVKRIFVIAIYFVISPIIIATGVRDDGFVAANFAKTLVVKFSSIMFITIGMQVALTITSGSYGLNQLINQWDIGRITKMCASITLIIGGLLAGYTTTGSISKMLGDDSSIMESIQDVMLLTRGMHIAAAPVSMVASGLKSGISAGASKLFGVGGATANTINPLTSSAKAHVYGSRMKEMNSLGNSVGVDQIRNYRDYKNLRRQTLSDMKGSK